jgi:hypothetical protein
MPSYNKGMIAQDGSILSPEGWTVRDDASGAITYIDDNWNVIGHDYPNATYSPEMPVWLEPGQSLATDEEGNALMTQDGQYIVAPVAGTGTYNDALPSFVPGAAEAEPAMPVPPPLPASEVPPQASPDALYNTPTMPAMSSPNMGSSYGGQRPSFANGVQHPLWSGQPLTPGGKWNTGQSAPRQNVYNPDTGAWAGNGAGAPRGVEGSRMYGGGSFSGGSGGSGGGGGGSALYQAWRDKLTAKLYPGSGSGYSGSSGGSSASGGYPPEEKMKGPWAKKVDPSQASTLSYRPSMLIPKVAPGLSPTSPLYQEMAAAPAAQLGTIMDGTKRAKQPVYPTTKYKADGSVKTTKGQSGNIGSLTVNSIGNYYDRAINKETTPTYGELIHNLDRAGKNSLLGTQVGGTNPLGIAATNASNLYSAAFSMLDSDRIANAYQAEVEGLIDQYGSKFLRKPVGKAPAMNKWVGRRTSF